MSAVAAQIREELERLLWSLVPLLGQDLDELFGRRPGAKADMLAEQLTSGDDHIAAETVIDLAAAGVIPDDPGLAWWASALGRAVAASVGHPSATHVSYSVAGAMLGITRGRVGQLVADGKLERHSDGGVDVGSIRRRIAERDTHTTH